MYNTTLRLKRLICRDTESIHSSDKFALTGALVSDTETVGIYLPTIQINDGEDRSIEREYSISSKAPLVGLSLTAWDLDQNDSWKENEEDIKKGSEAIAAAAALVPGYGTIASAVISGVSKAVIATVNIFNSFDKDDKLLDFSEWLDLPNARAYESTTFTRAITFSGSDPTGYSSWDYTLELEARYEWQPTFSQGTPKQSDSAAAMAMFRHRADAARDAGFVAGLPNFHEAAYNHDIVGGTVFLKYRNMISRGVEWRDVPLSELGNPNLDDFGARMRATQDYATRNGFVRGIPQLLPRRLREWGGVRDDPTSRKRLRMAGRYIF